jgi:hypothetical protein
MNLKRSIIAGVTLIMLSGQIAFTEDISVNSGSDVALDQVERPEATQRKRTDADRLQLDATSIRGNQELPRVLYIVPWKDAAIGDLVGKPVNSLIDEVLAPLDRDVFLRQTKYFDQLYGDVGDEAGR